MITYNDIYEASRKERYAEQLQPLPKNFVSEVAAYLHEKREIASKDNDVFLMLLSRQRNSLKMQ